MSNDQVIDAYERMKPFILKQVSYVRPAWVCIEDVWQDILLDGIRRVPTTYDPKRASLTTYVVWVARSCISNMKKKWARSHEYASEDVEVAARSESANIHDIIFRITEDLPPKCRMVIRYRYEGKSGKEIGEMFGFSKQRAHELAKEGMDLIREKFDIEDLCNGREI